MKRFTCVYIYLIQLMQNYCVDMYVYSKGILFVPDCNYVLVFISSD